MKNRLGAFHPSITLANKCLNLNDSTMDVVRLFFEVSSICLDKKDLSKIMFRTNDLEQLKTRSSDSKASCTHLEWDN